MTAKEGLFCYLHDELAVRNLGRDRPVVCLMDGERALWEAHGLLLGGDWCAGPLPMPAERRCGRSCFHREGSRRPSDSSSNDLQDLLQGRVGSVIEFRQRLTKGTLSGSRRKVLSSAIEYLKNNREHMKYDEYLAAGYPIGSGVAEGACRYVVKDRMVQTGMQLGQFAGAQAMLHVRALYLTASGTTSWSSGSSKNKPGYMGKGSVAGGELRPNDNTQTA